MLCALGLALFWQGAGVAWASVLRLAFARGALDVRLFAGQSLGRLAWVSGRCGAGTWFGGRLHPVRGGLTGGGWPQPPQRFGPRRFTGRAGRLRERFESGLFRGKDKLAG